MTRLEKLRARMAQENLSGLLVTQPDNRRYLSGFTGSAGILIITADRQLLATDSRYYEQVRQECPDWELVALGYDFTGQMLELLHNAGLGAGEVGCEASHVSLATWNAWQRALQGQILLVQTEGLVESLRLGKDAGEVARIRQAVALADEAFAYIAAYIQPGQTEAQVAWELESYMRTHGATALSFETIVASGPNAAKPHARASGRVIQPGEPVTLDFGCIVDGYCSDITRTICLGEPAGETYLKVWHTVREAQQAALGGAKGGMTGVEVDQLARNVIKAAGYGDYFGHALGHGVGLAIHENPRYSFAYPEPVPAGAIVTVEPGIYLPGWGGVRIEDMVLVRDEDVEVLTTAPKEAVLKR